MYIAHIDTGKDFRGGQELLLSLARGLRERGHRQFIACPRDSAVEDRAHTLDFEILRLPDGKPTHAHTLCALRERLKQERCQIVHAHDAHAQTISAIASAGLGVRRVASRLVAFTPRHPAIHRLKYTWTCDRVIALSQPVRAALVAAGIPDRMIEVIEPGIEPPAALPTPEARQRARAKWGLADSNFAIGHVGAFTPEKGQDIALEAAAILARTMPDVRMLLAGDGPLRHSEKMAELMGRTGAAARLLGFVEDLEEFHAALDLYIMPSRSEAWGLAAVHAMAYGLPVVASNVGGLAEVVEDGQTGWLIPADDAAALVRAIQEASADRERLTEFGRRARERSFLFSGRRAVERTESLYQRLLDDDRKQP